ncbi:uncharacterized protein [Antedon mediterranea]|uniref:uncharacterized protein n=1 Tax=Antedon mediterranea TaxID=105859 RepID=UPI003AF4F188
MPSKKVVLKWGFDCLGYDVDEDDIVTKIWCKTCREFCEICEETPSMRARTGAVKPDCFARGTSTIKKNNFQDHVKKSRAHEISVLRLTELNKMKETPMETSRSAESSGASKPNTLMPYLQGMSLKQHNQLQKKFQLAHFLVGNAKSFKFYADMAEFEKKYHGVDLGTGYINDKSCREIVFYISESLKLEKITEPLNNNKANYYSILNDGSSSAKTMDEKELFLIKTAAFGVPTFNVMTLEEPSSTTAEGLKDALDSSFVKMNFTFDRKLKELGMCSDGAAVNLKLHR